MGFSRSRSDRWFRGVCGGIAHQYGLPAIGVRVATVVLAIAIPGPSLLLTVAVYFILGFLLPESDTS